MMPPITEAVHTAEGWYAAQLHVTCNEIHAWIMQ